MERILTYQNEEIKDSGLLVGEERDNPVKLLDKATERYMKQLGDIERRCSRPAADTEKIFSEVVSVNETMLRSCAQFEQAVNDPVVIKAEQSAFREQTNHILSKSHIMHRSRTWPQGYQGDYKTLETLYRNTPVSDGIGYYLDRYALSSTLAVAVRGRIAKLGELLREELAHRRNPSVLDLACGSCREVFDLVPEIESSGARFTCIDLDADALDFALGRLSSAGLSSDRIEFIKYNALRLFDHETTVTEFGTRDIIYSVGYFDYLPDDFLVKLLRSLYTLLKPGGKLIAAFKDADRYRPQAYHWLGDWDGFLQRTEKDFERILRQASLPAGSTTATRDRSGVIIFYCISK